MGEKLPVTVTVILPTRNEEEALGPTLDAIPRGWCKDLEIMIVDGNSSDRTERLLWKRKFEFTLNQEKATAEHTEPVSMSPKTTSLSPWMRIAPILQNWFHLW